MALTNLEPGRDAMQASRCNGPEKPGFPLQGTRFSHDIKPSGLRKIPPGTMKMMMSAINSGMSLASGPYCTLFPVHVGGKSTDWPGGLTPAVLTHHDR